ncbi:unnamed protein product, partial [Prorocentrum cordatum]
LERLARGSRHLCARVALLLLDLQNFTRTCFLRRRVGQGHDAVLIRRPAAAAGFALARHGRRPRVPRRGVPAAPALEQSELWRRRRLGAGGHGPGFRGVAHPRRKDELLLPLQLRHAHPRPGREHARRPAAASHQVRTVEQRHRV